MYPLAHYLVIAIVVAGIVGIAYIILQKLGVTIPDFVVRIFWIIVLVVIGVVAIQFLLTLIR